MTKSSEEGENEVTREAKREAARTGHDLDAILEKTLRAAKQQKDTVRQMKVLRAQKFLKRRNKRKRKKPT